MVDYQFLGIVAAILAVVTGGSVLPVVAVTALVGLAIMAHEAAARWCRARERRPTLSDSDLGRWMAVTERVLRDAD